MEDEPLIDTPVEEAQTHYKKRKTVVWASVFLLLVFVIVITLAKTDVFTNKAEKSLALLPLLNLTGNDENDYFVDGMHNALIGELGQIGLIRVISRTSTVKYRDKEMLLSEIAYELGVNIIVEGSVTGAGDSVRILLQVIDVEPKERHLFSKEYQDDM